MRRFALVITKKCALENQLESESNSVNQSVPLFDFNEQTKQKIVYKNDDEIGGLQ